LNNKGVLATILVIQLILLIFFTFAVLESKKESFSEESKVVRVSMFKVPASYYDLSNNQGYLDDKNTNINSKSEFTGTLNDTFKNYNKFKYTIGTTFDIEDTTNEVSKEDQV
jgi:hypothetical protein